MRIESVRARFCYVSRITISFAANLGFTFFLMMIPLCSTVLKSRETVSFFDSFFHLTSQHQFVCLRNRVIFAARTFFLGLLKIPRMSVLEFPQHQIGVLP